MTTGLVVECRCARARHVHGTEQAYISDRCRCAGCRGAHAERAAWRRRQAAYGRDVAHLVPAAGTARRLEALALLGWSCQVLAARLGWDPIVLHRVRLQPRILGSKAAAFTVLFEELWDRAAPAGSKGERISASRTRAMAVRRGYVPAMGWDDDEIDDPGAVPVPVSAHQAWDLAGCGTEAAYRRHYRRGEPVDEACRAAERRRMAERAAAVAS